MAGPETPLPTLIENSDDLATLTLTGITLRPKSKKSFDMFKI